MKEPLLYQQREFQLSLIHCGSREQIIEWLVWNDPNGTYMDRACEIEGMAITTLERAREIMRVQIDPIISVIPQISDKAGNEANISAIDQLVETQKYRHIVAWGKFLGFTPETVLNYVREAEADGAPADAIQKIDDQWLCVADIENESNRQRVNDLAAGN